MTTYSFLAIDEFTGDTVEITKVGVEYLGDFLEAVMQFTNAVGYGYVKGITATGDNGYEVSTDL